MTHPLSTYRLQFHREFPFARGAAMAPYLQALGVSHVYSSPILTARAGSNHGYDVVDFRRINPELGGEEGFRAMATTLRAHGLGIILDIVPNHMAVGGADNAAWLDILENGKASAYASWFDIDFEVAEPELRGKVYAPYLGAPYCEVLRSGELRLIEDERLGKPAIAYHHHRFPIRPEDVEEVRRLGPDAFRDENALHHLLERQNFRLAWWRTAGDRVNYRRFFDITELAGVRIENREAFEATHRIAFALFAEGLIDGVRVDHIDGLADPAAYTRALRDRLNSLKSARPAGPDAEPYVIVEKILEAEEWLPEAWPVEGTTGYDFMNEVSALQHDAAAAPALSDWWHRVSGRAARFEVEEKAARLEMLRMNFHGQLGTVVDAVAGLAEDLTGDRDITRGAVERAVMLLVSHVRVYRSYATGEADSPGTGPFLDRAFAAARQEPGADLHALDLLARVLNDRSGKPSVLRAIRRFNQLTAPVAAKAVEDTAFYRHGRLLSRNDVGFNAGCLGISIGAFHEAMRRRAEIAPASMLATATHDHKRGEDVRARLAILSERADEFIAAVDRWQQMNRPLRPPNVAGGDEAMLYQMMLGAWPHDLEPHDAAGLSSFRDRLAQWQQKALREAKILSTWLSVDEENEAAARTFLDALLDPDRSSAFLRDLHGFVSAIARPGCLNGLVQVALRLTAPGIPDTYQGTELWDLTLVDPDNRRAVDYDLRHRLLREGGNPVDLAGHWSDGAVKLALIRTLLGLRQRFEALFRNGSYQPLAVEGARHDHVVAFAREYGADRIVVIAALRCAHAPFATGLCPTAEWWADTRVRLPDGPVPLHHVLGGEGSALVQNVLADPVEVAVLLQDFPVAVLASSTQSA